MFKNSDEKVYALLQKPKSQLVGEEQEDVATVVSCQLPVLRKAVKMNRVYLLNSNKKLTFKIHLT